MSAAKIAVVIPCYRVRDHVLGVIAAIGPEVALIFAVDDKCPEQSGQLIQQSCTDRRVRVIFHPENKGVGGAVMTGYGAAMAAGADIVVKIDGDGQMDPTLLPRFVAPILRGEADYTKGNRFYSVWSVRSMPPVRLAGNAALSLLTKLSSGYWTIFDPTNGYTAVHTAVLARLEFKNIAERYFFESDMLVNLGGVRAVVQDVPMEAVYGDEKSSLKINKILPEFLGKHIQASVKRVLYNYFLRNFSLASLNLVFGALMLAFGTIFGALAWVRSVSSGELASTGTVMLAALPVILGFQLVLSFISYDMGAEPTRPLHRHLRMPTAGDGLPQPAERELAA